MGPPDTGPYIAVCIYYMCVCEQVCVYGGKWENIGNRFQDLLRHLGEVKQKYMLHITVISYNYICITCIITSYTYYIQRRVF